MRVPYGVGLVVDLPLISQADTKLTKTGPTISAGDAKLQSDALILTTLTSKTRTFTSGGTYVIKPGDTITGHTSTATARVIGVRLTGGTWAGGDAAGVLFVESDSGTFQSEDLDVGSNLNVATITGALSAAGVFNEIATTGWVSIGIPSTMLTCRQASLIVRDATGAEWCDTGITFETEGHENAFDPQGCILTDTVNASGQTTTNIRLSGAPTNAPKAGMFFVVVSGTGVHQAGIVGSYAAGANYEITPLDALTTALDSTSIIKVYENAKPVVMLAASGHAALTEGYAADGAAGTLNQILYMIQQVLTEASISGTTLTIKKLDGSTTAGTLTLNSSTVPTSKTRAT